MDLTAKIKNVFKNRLIANRLVLLSLFIILGVGGVPYYGRAKRVVASDIVQYSTQVLAQIVANVEVKLNNYESLSSQFIANPDYNQLLQDYSISKAVYDISLPNQKFSNLFEGYAFYDFNIYDAIFIDESDPKKKALTMGEALSNSFIHDLRTSSFYRQVIEADGHPVWHAPVHPEGTPEYYLLLGRRIKQLFTGNPLGVLVIFIKETVLDNTINDQLYRVDDAEPSPSFGGEYSVVVDRAGSIISSPYKKTIGHSIFLNLENEAALRKWLMTGKASGSFNGRLHQKRVFMFTQAIGGHQWYLVNFVPAAMPMAWENGRLSVREATFLGLMGLLATLAVYQGVALTRMLLTTKNAGNSSKSSLGMVAPGLSGKDCPSWLEELSAREREILVLIS